MLIARSIPESRNWLPKFPKLLPTDRGDDQQKKQQETGKCDSSRDGVVLKSVNLIQNEVFCSENTTEESTSRGIIEDALVYLNFSQYS